jgi:anti-anti-sigma factor
MVGTGAHDMTSGRLVAVKQLPEKLSVKQGRLFVREVESCLKTDRPRVVLDCSRVRQLDSAGIQVLLRCLEEAMKRNGDVKLAAIPPGAAAILELTRVDRLFETFDNTADAVNSFRRFPTEPFQQAPGYEHSTLSSTERRNGFEDHQSDSHRAPLGSEETTRISGRWLRRQIAGCLLLLLVAPLAAAVPLPQQETVPSQQVEGATSTKARPTTSGSGATDVPAEPSQPETLPNSPGTVRSQTVDDNRLPSGQQPSPKQNGTQEPLGTAAAEYVKTTGVAASRPAGAAIAPAKQRRARSILIKVGVIAGAGVAVGAVVALSSASPSRPH